MVEIFKAENLDKVKEDLIGIYKSAYIGLEEYAYTRRSDIKSYLKWLYRVDRDGLLMAKDCGRIVGFIFFCHSWWDRTYGAIGEIHELAVVPEHQRRGIGKALLEDAIIQLRKYHNIFGLWVGDRNKKARGIYEKMGFLYAGRIGKWIRMIRKE